MSPINILVIDDNKNDLLMAKFVIMRMGYNPILLDNPSKAIETLQSAAVSVIVLDYDMPGMTGLDVLKKIKRNTTLAKIPIVMLTGNSSSDHVRNTVQQGAMDYIVKPIDPTIFETKINKIINAGLQNKKEDWIEFELDKATKAELKIFNYSRIISIGEVSLTLAANQDYPVGFTFFSDAQIFHDLEIKNPALKVEASTKTSDGFIIRCTMVGLSEVELKKVRLYQKLLVSKKVS